MKKICFVLIKYICVIFLLISQISNVSVILYYILLYASLFEVLKDSSIGLNRRVVRSRVEIRGATLIFHQIEVEDAGQYECLARNAIANASAVAEVIVSGKSARLALDQLDVGPPEHTPVGRRFHRRV